MYKKQKIMTIILILVLIASIVSATAKKESDSSGSVKVNPSGFPIVDETLTVEMIGTRAPNQADWNTMRIFEWYEDLTNIHVNWTTVDRNARDEKKKLIFASNDLPDALYGMSLTPQEEIIYGAQQGLLIPLEDLYAKWAPNITKYLDSDPMIRKTYTAPDGHIYTFPSGTDRNVFLNIYTMINTKWLDVLGLKMPETVDDFYTVLKAFKTGDPNGNGKADEIPLCVAFTPISITFWGLLQWFGITSDKEARVYVEDNGKVVYVPTDDRTREAVKWFNKLWKEGLLDPETFTQKYTVIDAKGKAEEAELLGAFQRSTIAWTVGFERAPDYAIMPALKNHLGTKIVTGKIVNSKGRFSITNKAKNPAALVRWIDYFASIEGSMNIQMGPEGENWEWVNATQWKKIKKDVETTAESTTPKNGTSVPFINYDQIITSRMLDEGEIDWQAPVYAGIDKYLNPYRRGYFPDAYMSVEQVSVAAPIQADLNTYVDQMIAQFIVGDAPLSDWDEYVANVKQIGSEKLVAIYQEVYDTFNK